MLNILPSTESNIIIQPTPTVVSIGFISPQWYLFTIHNITFSRREDIHLNELEVLLLRLFLL